MPAAVVAVVLGTHLHFEATHCGAVGNAEQAQNVHHIHTKKIELKIEKYIFSPKLLKH